MVLAGDSAGTNYAFGTALKAKKAGEYFVLGLYLICPFSSFALMIPRKVTSTRACPSWMDIFS